MHVSVNFQDERVDYEVPDGRLVAAWRGPPGVAVAEVPALVSRALEDPVDYPPLRQALVPGDRVVIALGADVPEAAAVLGAVCGVLESAGVEPESVTVLSSAGAAADLAGAGPPGVVFETHDPDDRDRLAYLATTTGERRVYLNRLLTDADFVLPVGRLAFDPVFGYRGPWSAIYPELSDTDTRRSYQAAATDAVADREHPRPLLKESAEVGWLLGCHFQLGLVPGVSGLVGAVAGLGTAVMDQGARGVEDAWVVRAGSRAELVIAGIGLPGQATHIDDLARGLATATGLVRRGGKIVLLSRAGGEPGPALRRLIAADDPRVGPAALRGHESDPDYAAARQLALTLAWADVYVLSALSSDDVEGLSMIPLDRPEEARRLVAVSGSCLLVSQADLARAVVADDAD